MKKSTRNFLIFAALGGVGYLIFRRLGAEHAAAAASAAKQGAAIAANFTSASAQPVDAVLSQYGMSGMRGRVVSEQ